MVLSYMKIVFVFVSLNKFLILIGLAAVESRSFNLRIGWVGFHPVSHVFPDCWKTLGTKTMRSHSSSQKAS